MVSVSNGLKGRGPILIPSKFDPQPTGVKKKKKAGSKKELFSGDGTGRPGAGEPSEGAGSKAKAGGSAATSGSKRDRSGLSKQELNKIKRGGAGKHAFKSKAKYKRKRK